MKVFWILVLLIVNHCALKASAQFLDIRQFGAKNDGKTLNTAAIQAAIDSCHQLGGGQVLIPAGGVYLSGTLFLKTHVFLYLEPGALLKGSSNIADYDKKHPQLIFAEYSNNLGFFGAGVIDGNGAAFWDQFYLPLDRPEPWIVFEHCQNLQFKGVQLLNSPAHVLVLEHCDGAVIDGLRIVNTVLSPNTDGIDIADTRNVSIQNCYIQTGDDAICLKSHQHWVENIIVTNNVLMSDDTAIKFGTGGDVGTRHCIFSDNVIRNSRYGIALFQMDGGVYEYCQFNNMTIETSSRQFTEYPIFVDIDKRRADDRLGSIRNLIFSNLQLISRGNCLLAGQPNAKIQGLTFRNICLHL
jgi:polygalacturonase